jgi:hypothetical protein
VDNWLHETSFEGNFDVNDMLQDSTLFDGWFDGMREQCQASKRCRQHCRFAGVGDELRRLRNPTKTPKPSGHYRRRQHVWEGELWVITLMVTSAI